MILFRHIVHALNPAAVVVLVEHSALLVSKERDVRYFSDQCCEMLPRCWVMLWVMLCVRGTYASMLSVVVEFARFIPCEC
jgi:hypothetical protein